MHFFPLIMLGEQKKAPVTPQGHTIQLVSHLNKTAKAKVEKPVLLFI